MTFRQEELLGNGEEQSIRLAIGERAGWLLVDDFDAADRIGRLQEVGLDARVTGTLGIILAACQKKGSLARGLLTS